MLITTIATLTMLMPPAFQDQGFLGGGFPQGGPSQEGIFGLSAPLTTAPPIDARVKSVSMFKNGYAMVVREMRVPAAGEYAWEHMPRASLGTLWIAGDDAVGLDTVGTARIVRETPRPIRSLAELLTENVGKQVTLGIAGDDPVTTRTVAGKLVSAESIVVVETGQGSLAFPSNLVTSLSTKDGTLKTTGSNRTEREGLRVRTRAAGKVTLVSLEKGYSWAPNYSLDLRDGRLNLSAKATMFNEVQDLEGAEVRFITGFPNVPYAFVPDPLTGAANLDQFLSLVQGIAPNAAPVFSGGGSRTTEIRTIRPTQPVQAEEFSAENTDDLFFYPLANVNGRRGERSYHALFQSQNVPYQDVYTWSVENVQGDQGASDGIVRGEDVWHTIRFRNEGPNAKPLSTGAVTLFRNGQLLGQDMFAYTPVNGDIAIRLNKALDITATAEEVEVSRERASTDAKEQARFDRLVVRGRLDIVNRRSESVLMRITRTVGGDVVRADEKPQLTKQVTSPGELNVPNTLEWTVRVPANQRKQIVYEYKLLSRGQ
jgi:hypothetical protein